VTFAPRYTDWPDLLSPLYAREGNVNGDDAEPDVNVQNPTSGQIVTIDLDHTNRNKIEVTFEGITLSDVDSIAQEFQRASDDVWETTGYRIKELGSSNKTNPVDAANLPVGDYDAGRGPIHAVVTITGAGLAEPTKVESMDWDNASEMHDNLMTNTNLHKATRFRMEEKERERQRKAFEKLKLGGN